MESQSTIKRSKQGITLIDHSAKRSLSLHVCCIYTKNTLAKWIVLIAGHLFSYFKVLCVVFFFGLACFIFIFIRLCVYLLCHFAPSRQLVFFYFVARGPFKRFIKFAKRVGGEEGGVASGGAVAFKITEPWRSPRQSTKLWMELYSHVFNDIRQVAQRK